METATTKTHRPTRDRSAAQRVTNAGLRVDQLPIGRTKAYALIAEGKLIAKKLGRATIILNWPEYVASLPDLRSAA